MTAKVGINEKMDSTKIVQIIRKHLPAVRAIYLFGSFADNSSHAGSDVDLAVLIPDKPTGEKMFDLKAELVGQLKCDVDIVDLARADSVTTSQVVVNGIRLFSDPSSTADFFETMAMSRYALLNEERAEILEDILKTGTIYNG